MAGGHTMDMKRNQQGLTPQQEIYAVAVASGKTLTDAYREAYPKSQNWKEESLWNKASALSRHGLVQARISDLRQANVARVQEEIVYTAKVAMSEAQRALELAERANQPGAMVAAIQLRAKLNGLLVERKEVSVTQMGDMTPSEKGFLLEQAKELLEERRRLLQRDRDSVVDVDPK